VTFDVAKVADGSYGFCCSFPVHISMMKGTIVVK